MNAIAEFIMRGKTQAVLASSAFAFLAFLIMPMGLLFSGAVALVTLAVSISAGLQVMVLTAMLVLAGAFLVSGSIWPGLMIILEFGFPVWVLAVILANTANMNLVFQTAVGMMIAAVIGFHIWVDNVQQFWIDLIEAKFRPAFEQSGVVLDAGSVADIANILTAVIGGVGVLLVMSGLFVGRLMQARLYNPEGFKKEFYALQLGRGFAMLTTIFMVLAFFDQLPGSAVAADLVGVTLFAMVLQGTAVAHWWLNAKQASTWWFVLMYGLLLVLPQATMAIASLGYVDAWFDLKRDKSNL